MRIVCYNDALLWRLLLVGIFDESLIFWYERRHDAVVGLVLGGLHILIALTHRIDGVVNGEREAMPAYELHVAHARQNVKRTSNNKIK